MHLVGIISLLRHYCICYVEYLHEDGRKRLLRIVGLPHVCMLLNLIVVQLLECKWTIFCEKGTAHKVSNFYRRSKKVVPFDVWHVFWDVGYPPPSWLFLKMELSVCTSYRTISWMISYIQPILAQSGNWPLFRKQGWCGEL